MWLLSACDHVDLCTVSVSVPHLVDPTPPTPGAVSVTFLNTMVHYEEEDILVEWHGFKDAESGVESFYLGIGSIPHSQDAMEFGAVAGSSHFLTSKDVWLEDGKWYYFQIKVCFTFPLFETDH